MTTLHRNAGASHPVRRRQFFPLIGATALAGLILPSVATAQQGTSWANRTPDDSQTAVSRYVYVGTYTAPYTSPGNPQPSTARGIYVFQMDGDTGGLTPVQVFELDNPAWVTVDADLSHLYAVSEVTEWNGTSDSGAITAFAIDAATGMIRSINNQPTLGAGPAHVALDPSGTYAVTSNFKGGSWSVLPILSTGGVGPASSVFAVTGRGPNTTRQAGPHAHETTFDPAGRYVFGNDLGTDHVWSWKLDTNTGALVPNANLQSAQVASGSGPRHLAFDPHGKTVYAVSEMASSITAFSYDSTQGTCTWLQTVSAIPADFTGLTASAEIAVHPSGNFLYASNRGHNSIVSFHIDRTTGALDLIGWIPTEGWVPRSFGIDPSGAMMLVGNQSSDTVVPFRINQVTGELSPTGAVTTVPVPVSFAFGRATT